MKRAWLAAALLVLAAGCFETTYRIQMESTDGQMRRVLDVQRRSTAQDGGPVELEPDEVAALEKIYADRLYDPDSKTYSYSGQFGPVLPSDVGGAGLASHGRTSLGEAWGYVERFRGVTDLYGQVQLQFHAADRTVDILIGWLEGQMGTRPDWAKLRTFLDQPVRNDLKNLTLLASRYGFFTDLAEGDGPAGILRVCLYLHEQGYVTPSDAMALSVLDNMPAQADRVEQAARHALASKAGISDAKFIDEVVALAKTEDQPTLREYLRTTPEYSQRLAEHKQAQAAATQPETQPAEPDPMDVLTEYLGLLIDGGGGDTDKVDMTLAVSGKPFATNGEYDEQKKTVSWQAKIEPRATEHFFRRPALMYAFWAEPNEAYQQAHFGQVALAESDLYGYCLWHQSLTADQAKAWDAYVASLAPGTELAAKLKTPPADVPGVNDVCERISRILFPPQTQETK